MEKYTGWNKYWPQSIQHVVFSFNGHWLWESLVTLQVSNDVVAESCVCSRIFEKETGQLLDGTNCDNQIQTTSILLHKKDPRPWDPCNNIKHWLSLPFPLPSCFPWLLSISFWWSWCLQTDLPNRRRPSSFQSGAWHDDILKERILIFNNNMEIYGMRMAYECENELVANMNQSQMERTYHRTKLSDAALLGSRH